MKNEINLLPITFQSFRFKRLLGQRLNRIYWAGLLGLLIANAAYLGSWLVVNQYEFHPVIQLDKAGNTTADNNVIQQVQATNQLLQALHQRLSQHEPWTPLVTELLTNIPDGILISELAFKQAVLDNKPTHALQVSGIGASRKVLADFETEIKSFSWIKQVDAPLHNLTITEQPTISFTFNLYRTE